jgi:hypothetical protein
LYYIGILEHLNVIENHKLIFKIWLLVLVVNANSYLITAIMFSKHLKLLFLNHHKSFFSAPEVREIDAWDPVKAPPERIVVWHV